jgi:hypothetical protein
LQIYLDTGIGPVNSDFQHKLEVPNTKFVGACTYFSFEVLFMRGGNRTILSGRQNYQLAIPFKFQWEQPAVKVISSPVRDKSNVLGKVPITSLNFYEIRLFLPKL